jgi:DNA-binding transcriptional regulator GbsR (MarR family)
MIQNVSKYGTDTEVYRVLEEIIYQERFSKPITPTSLGEQTRFCKNGISQILQKLNELDFIKIKYVETKDFFESPYQISFQAKNFIDYSNACFINMLTATIKSRFKKNKKQFNPKKFKKELIPIKEFLSTKTYAKYFLEELSFINLKFTDETSKIPQELLSTFEKNPPLINKEDYYLLEKANEKYLQIFQTRPTMLNKLRNYFYITPKQQKEQEEYHTMTKWLKQWRN